MLFFKRYENQKRNNVILFALNNQINHKVLSQKKKKKKINHKDGPNAYFEHEIKFGGQKQNFELKGPKYKKSISNF